MILIIRMIIIKISKKILEKGIHDSKLFDKNIIIVVFFFFPTLKNIHVKYVDSEGRLIFWPYFPIELYK